MTILTRLVTFCTHHRPQSRHISGKCLSMPILTLSGSYGVARGLMLPIESERVQRAIFGACQTNAATLLWLAGRPGLTRGADRLGRDLAGRRPEPAAGLRFPDPGSGRIRSPDRWSASGRGVRLRGSRPPRG